MLLIGIDPTGKNYVFKSTEDNKEIVEIAKNQMTYSQAQHYFNQGWTPQMLGIKPDDLFMHDEAFVIRFKKLQNTTTPPPAQNITSNITTTNSSMSSTCPCSIQ